MSDGVDHAQVRANPPVLTLAHILAAFLLQWLLPLPWPVPAFIRLLGGLLVVGGLAVAFGAVRAFSRVPTTLHPHGTVTAVVTSGPYRFSRNPIYISYICMLAGFPLALNSYWGAILSPLLVLLLDRLVIRYEEAYLESKFGQVYRDYKSRVRRWL
jgi:protein-S-isoprenylcysteine O-methyltransferase Ste14